MTKLMEHFAHSLLKTEVGRKVWSRLLGARSVTKRVGTFREKESFGIVSRPNYVYGMLRAADTAKFFGLSEVTVCEFGVATGRGLINMMEVAVFIEQETGVRTRIVGFDTGTGLPAVIGYKDHPELWSGGDFSMGDPEQLRHALKDRAELILGDINDTISRFATTLTPQCPLGFVSIDVDIYSGTVAALRVLQGESQCFLPAISFYLDDVGSYFSNEACGELAAVAEHNQANPMRPIFQDHSLPGRRSQPFETWYKHMYACHILDHPHRNRARERGALSLDDHLAFMAVLK